MSELNAMRGPADATVCSAAAGPQRPADEPHRSADTLQCPDCLAMIKAAKGEHWCDNCQVLWSASWLAEHWRDKPSVR
jgi:hypothetical protein